MDQGDQIDPKNYSAVLGWMILVFVETGVIVYLFLIKYPFPNLIPDEISELYALGTYFFALLILFFLAFLYQKERMEALISDAQVPSIDGNVKGAIQSIQEIKNPHHDPADIGNLEKVHKKTQE